MDPESVMGAWARDAREAPEVRTPTAGMAAERALMQKAIFTNSCGLATLAS